MLVLHVIIDIIKHTQIRRRLRIHRLATFQGTSLLCYEWPLVENLKIWHG
jgi:hypothetical protein